MYPHARPEPSATNDAVSRKGLTTMLVMMLLALVPATAFADGAGDDQYQDPLAAPTTPKKTTKKVTTAPAATTQAATTTPAATAAPTSASTSASATTPSSELPRTGLPASVIGLGGATLAAAGLALRRRTAE
jgi:hypothetical protein